MENELITIKEAEPLDYLFGNNRHTIESDADYHVLGLVFDEAE